MKIKSTIIMIIIMNHLFILLIMNHLFNGDRSSTRMRTTMTDKSELVQHWWRHELIASTLVRARTWSTMWGQGLHRCGNGATVWFQGMATSILDGYRGRCRWGRRWGGSRRRWRSRQGSGRHRWGVGGATARPAEEHAGVGADVGG
jgi:hypothetical protein